VDDIYRIFSEFKESYPDVYSAHEGLGKLIHERSGPPLEKTWWLLKIVISGASNHKIALATHIAKANEAGLTGAEIIHASPDDSHKRFSLLYGGIFGTQRDRGKRSVVIVNRHGARTFEK